MAYTTINKSTDYFNTKLYTGNNADGNAITGVGHSPDFVWIKQRNAMSHRLYDKIRGVNSTVSSDNGDAANQYAAYGQFESFDSDGFTVGVGTNTDGTQGYGTNQNSQSIASWNWKANGAGSANTDGTISSTVSANTTSGFSIVSYTGTGANATVGHGLGVAPKMIMCKNLSAADDWAVYNTNLGNDKYLRLNQTNAVETGTSMWNNTAPTSSVFSLGSYHNSNGPSENMIAYCFAEKPGYSKFGSYTGNGSDTQFIYLGFTPSFFLWKSTTQADAWGIMDNKRDTFNDTYGHELQLRPNEAAAEIDGSGDRGIDFLSNGVCLRGWASATGTVSANESGQSYIFMAFAEAPLVGSNNVPCTAR